jgi:hypothetical protein
MPADWEGDLVAAHQLISFVSQIPFSVRPVCGGRCIVDHSNWFGLQIWNEFLQSFLIICVVHVVVVISTFWIKSIGYETSLSSRKKETIYLKSRNVCLNSEMCVFSAMNLMYYYQHGRYWDVFLWKQKPSVLLPICHSTHRMLYMKCVFRCHLRAQLGSFLPCMLW